MVMFIFEDSRDSCIVNMYCKAGQSFPFLSQCSSLLRKLFNKVPTHEVWLEGNKVEEGFTKAALKFRTVLNTAVAEICIFW